MVGNFKDQKSLKQALKEVKEALYITVNQIALIKKQM